MAAEMADLPYPRFPDNGSDDDLLRPVKTLPPLKFKEKHKQLRARLSPLQQVQRELEQQLGAASTEVFGVGPGATSAAPFDPAAPSGRRAPNEFSINSSNGWKSALDKFRKGPGNRSEVANGTGKVSKDVEEEIAEILHNCREDIKTLWEDPIIKEVLSRRRARIEDAPGLYVSSF